MSHRYSRSNKQHSERISFDTALHERFHLPGPVPSPVPSQDQTTDAEGNRQCAIVPHLSELSITLDGVFPTADLDQVVVLLVEVLMARWDCHEEPKLWSIILKGKCSSSEASFDPRDVFKLTPKQVTGLKEWESQGLNISISVIDDGETI